MTEYIAHYSTEGEYAVYHFEADLPEQALQRARKLYERNRCVLQFEPFIDMPLEEIEISSDEGDRLAAWRSEDLYVRLAAHRMLNALTAAYAALNTAPRFKVPSLDTDSFQIAALCRAALDAAKPSES